MKTRPGTVFFLLLACILSHSTLAENVTTSLDRLTLTAIFKQAPDWPQGPTVLITHGTMSHNRSEFMSTLQTLFHDSDISTLAINLSLGENERTGSHDCDKPQRHYYEDGAPEIAAWVNWLKKQGASNIVVLGHSRGANQVARTVVAYPDPAITAMILIAPPVAGQTEATNTESLAQARALMAAGKPHALMEKTDFLYCKGTSVEAASFLSYYDSNPAHNTSELLLQLDLPILIFAGTEDMIVPVGRLKSAFAPLPPSIALRVIEGADHFFRDLNADELVELSIDFLSESE